jgi:hypothetical protein
MPYIIDHNARIRSLGYCIADATRLMQQKSDRNSIITAASTSVGLLLERTIHLRTHTNTSCNN